MKQTLRRWKRRRHHTGGRPADGRSLWRRGGHIVGAFVAHTDALEARAEASPHGTRKRSFALAGAGMIALGSMFSLVSANVLAVNFPAHNEEIRVYTDQITGSYAGGWLGEQQVLAGDAEGAIELGVKEATLDGLCLLVTKRITGFGRITAVVTGGDPVDGNAGRDDRRVRIDAIYLSSPGLSGDGRQMSQVVLGRSADTATLGPELGHPGGKPGNFGLGIKGFNLDGLEGTAYGIDLQGQVQLPDVDITLVRGEANRGNCA